MRKSRIGKKGVIAGGLLLAACASVVPITAASAGTSQAGAVASPIDGCGHGVVCMYKHAPHPRSVPEHRYHLYGCYNLRGEYGTRWVFNNQNFGAKAKLYHGRNCTKRVRTIPAGHVWKGNITPINSLSLTK